MGKYKWGCCTAQCWLRRYGLVRPRVLLSTGVLDHVSHAQLEAIVRHERAHLRRHDPLRLMLARALADALPAHAAMRTLATVLPLTQELAADRAVLSAVGAEALATALLKIGDALGPLQGQPVAVGGFSALNARIDQLLGDSPPLVPSSSKAVLTVLATLVVSPLLCTVGLLAWYITLGPSPLRKLRQRRGREYGAPSLPRGARVTERGARRPTTREIVWTEDHSSITEAGKIHDQGPNEA